MPCIVCFPLADIKEVAVDTKGLKARSVELSKSHLLGTDIPGDSPSYKVEEWLRTNHSPPVNLATNHSLCVEAGVQTITSNGLAEKGTIAQPSKNIGTQASVSDNNQETESGSTMANHSNVGVQVLPSAQSSLTATSNFNQFTDSRVQTIPASYLQHPGSRFQTETGVQTMSTSGNAPPDDAMECKLQPSLANNSYNQMSMSLDRVPVMSPRAEMGVQTTSAMNLGENKSPLHRTWASQTDALDSGEEAHLSSIMLDVTTMTDFQVAYQLVAVFYMYLLLVNVRSL